MIHHLGASLNEQHTAGSLIGHAYSTICHYSQISKCHMPAISLARAANVATYAWTKLYNEIMGFLVSMSAIHTVHNWLYLK